MFKTQKNLEVITIEHKGIKVLVQIDYLIGKASIVETRSVGGNPVYVAKNWVFVGRGLEYMKGWLTVLEAMTMAVKYAQKELEVALAQASAFKDNQKPKGEMKEMLRNIKLS